MPPRRRWRRPLPTTVVTAAVLLAACAGPPAGDEVVFGGRADCRAPGEADGQHPAGSLEEANLIATGELFRVYGADAEPLRRGGSAEILDVAGQPVWRLDGDYEVTVDGQRRRDAWTLWVGFDGAELTVLCAEGPPDIPWPPEPAAGAAAPWRGQERLKRHRGDVWRDLPAGASPTVAA